MEHVIIFLLTGLVLVLLKNHPITLRGILWLRAAAAPASSHQPTSEKMGREHRGLRIETNEDEAERGDGSPPPRSLGSARQRKGGGHAFRPPTTQHDGESKSFGSIEAALVMNQRAQQLAGVARELTTSNLQQVEADLRNVVSPVQAEELHSCRALLTRRHSEQLSALMHLQEQQQALLSKLVSPPPPPPLPSPLQAPPLIDLPAVDDGAAGVLLQAAREEGRDSPSYSTATTPAAVRLMSPVLLPKAMSRQGSVSRLIKRNSSTVSHRSSPGGGSCASGSGAGEKRRWRKGGTIGKGGFGVVHIAMDQTDGRIMAVKTVSFSAHEAAGRQLQKLSSLKSEIELMRSLVHPNIVRYKGAEREGNSLNIFMEYVAGGSIAQNLSRFGPLTESVVAAYTAQVINGLAYLHGSNVIHRDIKGANILLTVEGVCKLGDFGAATYLGAGHHDSFVGTPNWMAPEVITQCGHTAAADVWSLGCTVIEMITGEPPWENVGHSALQILNFITREEEVPIEEAVRTAVEGLLDDRGVSFVLSCLRRVPGERPDVQGLANSPWIGRVLEAEEEDTRLEEEWKALVKENNHLLKTSLPLAPHQKHTPLQRPRGSNESASSPSSSFLGGSPTSPDPNAPAAPVLVDHACIKRPPDFRLSHSPEACSTLRPKKLLQKPTWTRGELNLREESGGEEEEEEEEDDYGSLLAGAHCESAPGTPLTPADLLGGGGWGFRQRSSMFDLKLEQLSAAGSETVCSEGGGSSSRQCDLLGAATRTAGRTTESQKSPPDAAPSPQAVLTHATSVNAAAAASANRSQGSSSGSI